MIRFAIGDATRTNLDNPPTATELSQQLDLSDRTIRRGFRWRSLPEVIAR